MDRKKVPFDFQLTKTLSKLTNPGLLLLSTKGSGESNVMAIGWASVGVMWGKPIFQVLVRPSRYTYEFIEESGVFTVNVPSEAMRSWVGVCGTKSGRDTDKFGPYGMTLTPCEGLPTATIDGCPMVYECKVVHHNDLIPANLATEIDTRHYGGSDYHRVYFGEIVAAYAAEGY